MSYIEYKRKRRERLRQLEASGSTSSNPEMSELEGRESGVDLIKRSLTVNPAEAGVPNVFVVLGASVRFYSILSTKIILTWPKIN